MWYERSVLGILRPIWDSKDTGDLGEDVPGYRHREIFNPYGRHIRGDLSKRVPTMDISLPTVPKYSFLQFWTVSVSLALGRWESGGRHQASIVDRYQRRCGQITLANENFDLGVEHEFLVLSESRFYAESIGIANRKEDIWDLYWVMLVKCTDGIAERKGIGRIYQRALDQAFPPGPAWKQILLG